MKQLKFIVFLPLILILVACPTPNYKHDFRFSNNSNVDTYLYLGVAPREYGGSRYPDTAVSEVRVGFLFKKGKEETYSYNYDYGNEPTETLCLFIFDADTFDIYDWKEIQDGYKILKRYDISYDDIKRLKFQISYPPDERMKDIKMYPPYGE